MKYTCIINNYNYQDYVLDAVESALRQSVQFDEIIVVDDGSSDDSVKVLNEHYSKHEKIKIIAKKNGGQLSCFYEGMLTASGDIIFFLDADDLFCNNYLENIIKTYDTQMCDFVFCSHTDFSNDQQNTFEVYSQDIDLGYSVIAASLTRNYFYQGGNITSTLSIKKKFLERLFPYPFMDDWRIMADHCLVMGASIVGAKKGYCSKALVNRRIHDSNSYARSFDQGAFWRKIRSNPSAHYKELLCVARFRNFLLQKLGIDDEYFKDYLINEFKTIQGIPPVVMLELYTKLISRIYKSPAKRMRVRIALYSHYYKRVASKHTQAIYKLDNRIKISPLNKLYLSIVSAM